MRLLHNRRSRTADMMMFLPSQHELSGSDEPYSIVSGIVAFLETVHLPINGHPVPVTVPINKSIPMRRPSTFVMHSTGLVDHGGLVSKHGALEIFRSRAMKPFT